MNEKDFKKLIFEIAHDVSTFKAINKHFDYFQNWYDFGDYTILITYSETRVHSRIRVSAIYFDGQTYHSSKGDYFTESRFKCCLFVKLPYLIKSVCKEFFQNVT